jgi:hypothetical protein
MAHFAQIDENGIVIKVIAVSNEVLNNLPFPESEPIGVEFCQSLFGSDTVWKQTSYNNRFRKTYAGIGYTYNKDLDSFISFQPYSSWILNKQTCVWDPPVPHPTDGEFYTWDEENQTWVFAA